MSVLDETALTEIEERYTHAVDCYDNVFAWNAAGEAVPDLVETVRCLTKQLAAEKARSKEWIVKWEATEKLYEIEKARADRAEADNKLADGLVEKLSGEVDRLSRDIAEQKSNWRKLLEDVIESLPKCDVCGRPALRAFRRGEGRWCDTCSSLHRPDPEPPEYPRAKAVRAAMAALEKHPK